MDDHKALVLCVVSLLEGMSSGQARSLHHRPFPENMEASRCLLTVHEKKETPGMLLRVGCGTLSFPPPPQAISAVSAQGPTL